MMLLDKLKLGDDLYKPECLYDLENSSGSN